MEFVVLQDKKNLIVAIIRIDNIHPDRYLWAFSRAGYSEEKAVEVFPLLQGWLSADKLPTMNQLQDFARKFHVPFGYLFLNQPPRESHPFPVSRGTAGQSNYIDLNLCDAITLKTPIARVVELLRITLNLPSLLTFSYSVADTAIGVLTQRLEETEALESPIAFGFNMGIER